MAVDRFFQRVLLGSILAGLMGGAALAIPPQPNLSRNSLSVRSVGPRYVPQRRTLSPYLSVVPGNVANLSAVQFFNLVQPQIQQRNFNEQQLGSVQRLQTEIDTNAEEIGDLEKIGKRNPSGYMTHQRYFNQPLNSNLTARALRHSSIAWSHIGGARPSTGAASSHRRRGNRSALFRAPSHGFERCRPLEALLRPPSVPGIDSGVLAGLY